MEHIGRAIVNVIRSSDLEPLMAPAMVRATWDNCVGELLRKQTKTVEYGQGVLTVAARDATWKNHLVELSPQLIARLNEQLGDSYVKYLEVIANPELFESVDVPTKEGSVSEQAIDVGADIASAAASIRDESLRHAFLRYVSSIKKAQKI